jgi:hypothetical protein
MNNSLLPVGITLTTLFCQTGLYLASGGFSAGRQLTIIEAEIKLMRTEVLAANQIQDLRLSNIEKGMTVTTGKKQPIH